MKFEKLFTGEKPVIGMIHTGSFAGMEMLDLAKKEIEIYLGHGIVPLIENYFGDAEDCARVLEWIQTVHKDAIYGLNILGSYSTAFEMADRFGARFIQIDSVCGHLDPKNDEAYAKSLEEWRKRFDPVILGGVRFKYQPVLSGRSTEEDLRIGMERCDAIVCTGEGTGVETPMEKVREFKSVVGEFPVIVGAGVTLQTAKESLANSDGMIVGSWFKNGHNACQTVNVEFIRQFMQAIS